MIVALVCGNPDGPHFPGRNTFPLLGRPMMVYPLLAALHARSVERVFLTTDSPAMAGIAEHTNVTALERPAELQRPDATLEEIVADGCRQIQAATNQRVDTLVVLLCNSPTVTAGMIDKAVEIVASDRGWDLAASVSLHNEFKPQYALRIDEEGRIGSLASSAAQTDVYFADALLWAIRPDRTIERTTDRRRWLMDFNGLRAAPLVHEGYGDVDYPWQVPAIETWLVRHGFTSAATPYSARPAVAEARPTPRLALESIERRVLITTVPFGEPERGPLDLLDQAGIEYVINPIGRRLKEHELKELARDFGVLIAGTEPITAEVMAAAPHLRLISRVGIGLDNVDLTAARDRGIAVAYTPDAPSPAVAELTLGLMLSLLRHIAAADHGVRNGAWRRLMGRRLEHLCVGIIGVGRVGKRVIQLVKGAFPNTRLLAHDLEPDRAFGERFGVTWVEKDVLLAASDLVSVHVPLTPLTRGLISMREMSLMKNGALLVNTSRGGVVDERDLAEALRSGTLQGAALDVFEHEPYAGELAGIESCLLTCHMGSMSIDCRARMEIEATEEAVRFLTGEPLRRPVPEYEYGLAAARLV